MNRRPTPETDNNEYAHTFLEQYGYESSLQDAPVDWPDFARRLERELDEFQQIALDAERELQRMEQLVVVKRSNNRSLDDRNKRLERELGEARDKIERQAERIRYLEGATNHATGTPLSVALRERDSLQEQLDAAIMLGKMQERRHERELEQVREQYRLSSVCRELKAENEKLKQKQP